MADKTGPRFSAKEKAYVVKEKVKGTSSRQIAKDLGRSHGAINRIMKVNKIVKELIESEARRVIQKGLRESCDLVIDLVKEGKISGDIALKRLGFDAAKHITGIAGISGGAPGTVINTMIQVNQAPQMSGELGHIKDFLAQQWGLKQITDGSVVEGEVEEKDGD